MKVNQVEFVRFEDIDADKWDACIAKAPNALVYAQSWYLDKACSRWDALVMGDYDYVMPLISRKKIGIAYLYQPTYCQQLGIFPTPTKGIIEEFFHKAQQLYKFSEININSMNLPIQIVNGEFFPKKNHLLSLGKSYLELSKEYSSHTKRKLKKAEQYKLSLILGISVDDYLEFKRQNQKVKVDRSAYLRLRNILSFALTKSMGQIYGVYSPQNELCAAAFFIRFKTRVIYLNAATNNTGRDLNAMFYLIDQFIKEHSSSEFTLDFEGSMIPGVARLYEGFGANPEVYHQLKWNKLPVWLKWFKK